jgi:hypothetical protein
MTSRLLRLTAVKSHVIQNGRCSETVIVCHLCMLLQRPKQRTSNGNVCSEAIIQLRFLCSFMESASEHSTTETQSAKFQHGLVKFNCYDTLSGNIPKYEQCLDTSSLKMPIVLEEFWIRRNIPFSNEVMKRTTVYYHVYE